MERTRGEHALAVAKAALNAVPVVGGSIASLIADYVPTATQRTVQQTLDKVAEDVHKLGGRIDAESVNREEFAELFKSTYLVVVRTHQESKLRAAARLIRNKG